MKNLIALLLLLLSSTVHANCTLYVFYNHDLGALVKKNNGWNFPNFNEVCRNLQNYNLAVHITQMEIISTSATTVSTSLKVYPLEIKNKYDQMLLTSSGTASMVSNTNRTTETLDRLKYQDANDALNELTTKSEAWPEIIKQVTFIRKYIK